MHGAQKSYFVYKGFILVDQEDGYIEHVHVTPANLSEVNELKNIIENRHDHRI
ncbi:transposase, partial [Candidatus Bandiella numerosa]|uniref:transposase n=1 Tax=Candidatus Bandiella numerosa TaxID=2570586 RepID=UPI0034E0166C